jgi:hypothetical protein
MSNARRHRRALNTSNATRRQDFTAALIASRLTAGCTCQPDLRRHHRDGLTSVTVSHDTWCPAADHTSQVVIRSKP